VFCILTFQGFALTNFTDHLSQWKHKMDS
jgi:hypothetical protein